MSLVMRIRAPGRVLLTCLASATLSAALLSLVLRLDRADLRVPLNYLGDANVFLCRAKTITEGNWVWHNPRLGMPFGADWRDFPMNITLDSAVMWLLSWFSNSPALILNLAWMIAIAATAALAAYAFQRLRFSIAVSASAGIIFALLPYVYFRGITHLHSLYYAVPLVGLTAIEISRGKLITDVGANNWRGVAGSVRHVPAYAWIGCIIAGLAYTYTAFFAIFVLVAAAGLAFLSRRDLHGLIVGAALAATVAAVALADLSPSLVYWARNGSNAAMLFKSPAEAQLYGLKIRYLVTPVPHHPLPFLRDAESRLAAAKYPLFENENEWARLGTVGSIGFLCLIVVALTAAMKRRPPFSPEGELLGPAAALTLACALLATSGGFGDFFNAFLTPDIRCYTRIFPFIAFFCLIAAAVLAGKLERRLPPTVAVLLFGLITVLAAYDQAVPSRAYDRNGALYRSDAEFVRRTETVLPEGSAIFQLPYTDFPNEIRPAKLGSNDLLRPYLHSFKYRWSWAAISGTTPAEWNRQAAVLRAPEMLRALTQRGFSGLWVDLAGYEPEQSPESALTGELDGDPLRSTDGRFLFYDLRAHAAKLRAIEMTMTASERVARHPVQATFERGFYYEEGTETATWRWSLRRGRITLLNPLDIARTVTISMRIETADRGPHPVIVSWPGDSDEVHAPAAYRRTLELPPSGAIPLDLSCRCPAVRPPGSPRLLYFSVADFEVSD